MPFTQEELHRLLASGQRPLWLANADLAETDLTGVDLAEARLLRANLSRCRGTAPGSCRR